MGAWESSQTLVIVGSVGRKGDNRPADVALVQARLNLMAPPARKTLSVDGRNGPNTMRAIEDFQEKVVGSRKPDGRVDPGGRTLRHLNQMTSAAVWAEKTLNTISCPVRPAAESLPASIPYTRSLPLVEDDQAMAVLFAHLRYSEGDIPHFYCDTRDLVTIGVGCLVDTPHKTREKRRLAGRGFCREIMNRYGVQMVGRGGGRADLDEIYADWCRVFDGKAGAKSSRSIARLRISPGGGVRLARKQAAYFCGGMYKKYPYGRDLHGWIQLALIDARWNPAGIGPWGSTKHIREMWRLLDPSKASFDPLGAAAEFKAAWAHKLGKGRYGKRVAWRNARFREGALRMAEA
ncbi:MAG: peptidoglycan-binding domain-containing protein [Pseudomonadota bacterium]